METLSAVSENRDSAGDMGGVASSRVPSWIRQPLEMRPAYGQVARLLRTGGIHTVCEEARCPNRMGCWSAGTATFMIMGAVCTRHCAFCAVRAGQPAPLEADEPERVAEAARSMALQHVVVTSVTRDDLPDGGADHFAATIRALRVAGVKGVEVLVPDFKGCEASLACIREAGPDVFGHNIETVARLQETVRPAASYGRSLDVMRLMASEGLLVKSGLMVGLGETDEEVHGTLLDLARAGCSLLTVGQYLAPRRTSWPVKRYVTPGQFEAYEAMARELGFRAVACGPLVRSSWRAADLLREVLIPPRFSVASDRRCVFNAPTPQGGPGVRDEG